MVEVRNLIFDYPELRALNNVSFTIQPGTITALVGPNGCGKTTLMRCLAALSKPLSGSISIDGHDTIADPHQVHLKTGYLKDIFGLYNDLTVRQSLLFTAYSRLPNTDDPEAAAERAAQKTGADRFMDQRVLTLSRGMRQRVGIAQAIVHNPVFLLLDEPASGLDPEGRYELSGLMTSLCNSGMTLLVSSHILAELQDYSSEMLIMRAGAIVEHRGLTGVDHAAQKQTTMEVLIAGNAEPILSRLSGIAGVIRATGENSRMLITINPAVCSKNHLLRELIAMDAAVENFSEEKIDLQQTYIQTIKKKP